jgi:hypothetical protein
VLGLIGSREMARIVSIDWNVEDIRRVISEEDFSPAKTIDTVNFEIIQSPETREELSNAETALLVDETAPVAHAEQPAALEASETPGTSPDLASPTRFAESEVTPKPLPLPKADQGLAIPAGRPTRETINTLYLGVEFSIVRFAAGRWRWSVLVGQPAMLRVGEASSDRLVVHHVDFDSLAVAG